MKKIIMLVLLASIAYAQEFIDIMIEIDKNIIHKHNYKKYTQSMYHIEKKQKYFYFYNFEKKECEIRYKDKIKNIIIKSNKIFFTIKKGKKTYHAFKIGNMKKSVNFYSDAHFQIVCNR